MIEALMVILGVQTTIGLIGAVGTILAVIGACYVAIKKSRTWWKACKTDARNIRDALVGSEAIVDPETGKVLRPERVAIGGRVALLEEAQVETAKALTVLADNQARMIKVEENISVLQNNWERRERDGMLIIQEWEAWRLAHMQFSDQVKADIETIKAVVEDLQSRPRS